MQLRCILVASIKRKRLPERTEQSLPNNGDDTGVAKIWHEHKFHYRMLLDALDEKLNPGFSGGLNVPNEKVAEWRSEVIALAGNQ